MLVTSSLRANSVDFMITGSLASSLHGESRATHDIDLVVEIAPSQIAPLLAVFGPPRFYLSESTAIQAIRERTMFNLIDLTSGEIVDFWLLTGSQFDQARFDRRTEHLVEGQSLPFATAEDTVLAKLMWLRMAGESSKQLRDIRSICELQGDRLDRAYIETWARVLDLIEVWRAIDRPL